MGAADHACDLLDPARLVEERDRRVGPPRLHALVDPELGRRAGGDLGQVRDAQHLRVGSKRREARADDVCDAATDPGIHLVEDHRANLCLRVTRPADRLHGQHHPGQLASGDHPGERAWVLANVRRQVELHAIHPLLSPGFDPGGRRLESHIESRVGHGKSGEQLRHLAREQHGGHASVRREFPRSPDV